MTRKGALTYTDTGPFFDVNIAFENSATGVGVRMTREALNFREVFEVRSLRLIAIILFHLNFCAIYRKVVLSIKKNHCVNKRKVVLIIKKTLC